MAVILSLLLTSAALAHDDRPGLLSLTERDGGAWNVRLVEPQSGGRSVPVAITWPSGCRPEGTMLRCPSGPLSGLRVDPQGHALVVSTARRDGSREMVALHREGEVPLGQPTAWWGWAILGAEHAGSGLDHGAWVVTLMLACKRFWPAVRAMTAFTVGHAVSLALMGLGALSWGEHALAVELLIALSVLAMAREGLVRPGEGHRTLPIALVVGVVHGLGFGQVVWAGQETSVAAIAGVHLGIEAVQLVAMAGTVVLMRWLSPQRQRWALHALGALSACWVIERALAWSGAVH